MKSNRCFDAVLRAAGVFALVLTFGAALAACGGKSPEKMAVELEKLRKQVTEAAGKGDTAKAEKLEADVEKLAAELEKTQAAAASKAFGKAKFGKYPADYPIAYASMLGYSNSLTVGALFGPDAHLVTSFQGNPAVITLESSNGTQESFSAQILLTSKQDGGNTAQFRMQVTFEADSGSEVSYVRSVKAVIMLNGEKVQEAGESSNGDQYSDGAVLGMFVELMQLFWDVSKYK